LVPALGTLGSRRKHTLPDLPYDYGALEPHISGQIMQLHHSKHHAAYVNNLNATEEKYQEALAKGDVTTQVALQPAQKFNGGGHINH
ncbi:PREDICTED: superoxide dismutase [Mn], mitochondrial-like, partial [Myotis brandtii]|uniref:superoxide dismutase [Mn], mitochondrial-like n=1 Tax=Myotis brandtii TaxID=109478 RepID=UPI0003BB89B8